MALRTSIGIIEAFLAAENACHWAQWSSFLHPNVRYEIVGEGEVACGHEEYVARMQRAYTSFPDWQFQVEHICGDERVVIAEFDGAGHFVGHHGDRYHEGTLLRLRSVCVFGLRAGRITWVREYLDTVGYDRQLRAEQPHGATAE